MSEKSSSEDNGPVDSNSNSGEKPTEGDAQTSDTPRLTPEQIEQLYENPAQVTTRLETIPGFKNPGKKSR
jgi:hypothetical protein